MRFLQEHVLTKAEALGSSDVLPYLEVAEDLKREGKRDLHDLEHIVSSSAMS